MLQEIVMKDRIFVSGKIKDVIKHLKSYEMDFLSVQELISSKLRWY